MQTDTIETRTRSVTWSEIDHTFFPNKKDVHTRSKHWPYPMPLMLTKVIFKYEQAKWLSYMYHVRLRVIWNSCKCTGTCASSLFFPIPNPNRTHPQAACERRTGTNSIEHNDSTDMFWAIQKLCQRKLIQCQYR